MRLALAHARAETLQLARYPAYCVPTLALPGAPAPALRAPVRARRARAAARRLRGHRAARPSPSSSSASASRRAGRRRGRRILRTLPVVGRPTRLAGRRPLRARVRARRPSRSCRRRDHRLRRLAHALALGLLGRRAPRSERPVRAPRDRASATGCRRAPRSRREPRSSCRSPSAGASGRGRRTTSRAPSISPPSASRRGAGSRSSTAVADGRQPAAAPPRRRARRLERRVLRRSPGWATGATRASASADRHQIERSSASTPPALAGRGFACAPGRVDDRRRDLGELGLRDAEVPQPLEAAEPGELLDPGRRVVGPERLPEPRDRLRDDRLR